MKIRKELWFGFSLMGIIILATLIFTPWTSMSNGHLGLLPMQLFPQHTNALLLNNAAKI